MGKLSEIRGPEDVKKLSLSECNALAKEIRQTIINTVSRQGGHLASEDGTTTYAYSIHQERTRMKTPKVL